MGALFRGSLISEANSSCESVDRPEGSIQEAQNAGKFLAKSAWMFFSF
jgi:hypothetical protein